METETVQKIYQMFKDTVDLFEKLNIRYSVDGGSVIAIVRNKGLLPWDDDVDLVISQEDEPKLIYMIPMLKELGYEIIFDNSSYRIFDPNNPTIQGINSHILL